MKIAIDKVEIGARHRKEMGDIAGLAASIKKIGLLQPIGITEDNRLIFGERRLKACASLGWTEIEARVIDMPQIVVGENAENEVRKDFTPSERVAIARAIAEEIAERRGGDMSKRQNFATSSTDKLIRGERPELRQKIAEVGRGQRTADFAAKRAGFGNRETFRQAEHVVNHAEPEIVEAMDRGVISISAARKAADSTPEVQREIASGRRTIADIERERAREVREMTNSQPDLIKVQTITDATAEIVNCQMPPHEFIRLAQGPTLDRFFRSALGALAFLKAVVEVGDDQKRAG